jgi:hypothetical protein
MKRKMALALLATPALVLALATPALASDTTSPSLSLKPYASFVVGSTFTGGTQSDPNNDYEYWAQGTIHWTAFDPSGICSQTVTEQSYDTLGGDYDPVLGGDTMTSNINFVARSWGFLLDDFNVGRVPNRFVVRATDCAGNTATSNIATINDFYDIQDNNVTAQYTPAIQYAGTWKTSSFSGFSGGTTHNTTVRGNSATLTVGRGSRSAQGGTYGLVMEEATNRGSADVYVDGVRRATVNTHSSTTQHRKVVWQTHIPAGVHTIKVVNKATSGHPRIDLDTFIAASG